MSQKKTSLRAKVRALLLDEDEKALNKAGITYKSGALTLEGRKLVLDHIFQNDDTIRSAVVSVAKKIVEEDCKKKS